MLLEIRREVLVNRGFYRALDLGVSKPRLGLTLELRRPYRRGCIASIARRVINRLPDGVVHDAPALEVDTPVWDISTGGAPI